MEQLKELFEKNRRWVEGMTARDPGFFQKLSGQQKPQYLWIGCADSRVPANEIVGLLPGELFVHRNVSNVVAADDLNCLGVVQFAIDVLQVRHIIVCGHYGCGGVEAVMEDRLSGLSGQWLQRVQKVREKHQAELSGLKKVIQSNRLCELNVIEQVTNLIQTGVVEDAWKRQQKLTVHGWIYGINNGLIRDLGITISSPSEWSERYQSAVDRLSVSV